MTKVESPQVQTDRQWPFRQPSWQTFVEQNSYLNLGESLMVAIHI